MRSLIKDILIIASGVAVGLILGHKVFRKPPESQVIVRTDTCIVVDTLCVSTPVFRYSYIHDTVRTYFTTLQHDTVQVNVPIERRVYAEDSVYRAVVSGWRPRLDSLTIYPTTTTVTITNTILPKSAKWLFGITAGPSVLATPSGSVHAGLGASVGLTYRF